VAGDDPAILANAAHILAFFGEDLDTMLNLVDRALTLNASYARGWLISGLDRLYAGQTDIAIEPPMAIITCLPRSSHSSYFSGKQ
jgi:hypothetical protein